MGFRKALPLLLLSVALPLFAQAPAPPSPKAPPAPAADPWEALKFLVGTWEGSGSGKPGEALSGSCTFAFDLGGQIFVRTNRTKLALAAQEKPPAVHEDRLILYREGGAPGLRAIYFDNEGHTIHYRVTVPGPGQVLLESPEDAPGPRFRLIHALLPDGSLSTEFAMAPPGGAFQTYAKGVTRRVL